MAEPRVDVKFGASIDGLLSGVKQVEEAIKGLRQPIDALSHSFKEIGEAAGFTYVAEKLREWIVEAAEASEQALKMGASLGISAEAYQNLAGALSIVGTNAEVLGRSFYRLGQSADEALRTRSSEKAFAFKDAAIDAENFRNILNGPDGISKGLDILADAYKRLQETGGNTGPTGPLGILLGPRNFGEFINAVRRGSEGLAELKKRWAETNPLQAEGLERLGELAEKFNLLSGAVDNFGKSVTDAVSGPLGTFLDWTTKAIAQATHLIQVLRSVDANPNKEGFFEWWSRGGPFRTPETEGGGATEEGGRFLADILADIKQRESGGDYRAKNPKSTASGAYQIIDETWQRWARANGIDVSKYPTARDAPDAMQDTVALYGLRTEGQAPWKASEGRSTLPDVNVSGQAQTGRYEAFLKAKQAYEDYITATEEGGKREIAEVEQQIALAKARGATYEEQKNLYADLDAARQRMMADEDRATQDFRNKWGDAADEVTKKYKDHAAQRIQADTQFITESSRLSQQQVEDELAVQNARIKALNQSEAEELKQVDRRRQLNQISVNDAQQQQVAIVKVYSEMVAEILQEEQNKATGISSIERRITAEQVQQAMQAAQKIQDINDRAEDERLKKAEAINKTIAQDFASTFIQLITGKETFGQAFARLGEQLGQTLVEKMAQAFLSSSIFGEGGFGGLLGSMFGGAAGGGGFMSFLSGLPLIGGLFGGGAAASLFTLPVAFARGGIVPSAAGGWVIPSFQSGGILAQLHGGEMVLPRGISEGMQGLIAGGGAGPQINIHAMDTQTGAQFLMRNASSIASSWRDAGLRGGLSPRAISSAGRYP